MMPSATSIAVSVGAELRRLRERACISQRDLAQRTGMHRPIVSRIERGKHCPSLELAVLQAEACGGSMWDVLRAVDRASALPEKRVSARAGR